MEIKESIIKLLILLSVSDHELHDKEREYISKIIEDLKLEIDIDVALDEINTKFRDDFDTACSFYLESISNKNEKEITLNQIFSSTSKVNATAVQKTSTPNFKENCRGSGTSKSGLCVIEYDGAVYFGDTKYGKPNGKGIMNWNNGSIFIS